MPAFISNGPDIPEKLTQAHEEGKVVFFCGAGISYRAGLPDFKGLVDAIYKELSTRKTSIEESAYAKEQYDAVLHQLERRLPGQRAAVRKGLKRVLKPKWRKKGATETHEALLQLATDRNGAVRLVTTNFDRIFEEAAKKNKCKTQSYSAPLLPIPKHSRWDGVVYLHGIMPTEYDEEALNRLILTSGDFGLAYLTERWAARFVSQLFKDYIVCFVGYSINDPVLRYMMDALAADELLGEVKPEAYAFANYSVGSKDDVGNEWEAKGVTPLLYKIPNKTDDHSALYDTLNEWCKTYRDGVSGKEMVITQHASTEPLRSSRSDFAVGRVLWALSDSQAAKHFSKLVPVPPLKWLEPFSEDQFTHADLLKFGIEPKSKVDTELAFSLINRPSPYTHSPRMNLVDLQRGGSNWDDVMRHLAEWLLRHLGDPELILWLVRNGGELNEQFKDAVEHKLLDLEALAAGGYENELAAIGRDSPSAIPSPSLTILWRFILNGRVKTVSRDRDLSNWVPRLKREGVTPTLRIELRELLAPCVVIRPSFRWEADSSNETVETKKLNNIVDWGIELRCDSVQSTFVDEFEKPDLKPHLPRLLDDATLLLTDTLDMLFELGDAGDKNDFSYIYQPSISKHEQNRGWENWAALIELVREAWLVTLEDDCAKAGKVAADWWQKPYPIFKRMAMFAATQGKAVNQSESISWLLSDKAWWLWSIETQRELCRLLVFLSRILEIENRVALERAILIGPPREMFKDDLEPEEFAKLSERQIWHRLVKMQSSGGTLGEAACKKLNHISRRHPQWILDDGEKDEFSYWMNDVTFGEKEAPVDFELAPCTKDELIEWLKKYPSSKELHHKDGWRECCRTHTKIAIGALSELALQKRWFEDRWRDALQIGAEEELAQLFWGNVHDILLTAPDQFIVSIAHSLSTWLRSISENFEGHEDSFFELCKRLLTLEHKDGVQTEGPGMRAINHPTGLVTEALVRWWHRSDLKDGQGLHKLIKPTFTNICDVKVAKFRNGRVLLAKHAITLFRVDKKWATKYLLPLFDWNRSHIEAKSAWGGFLLSPRLYLPFLSVIKDQLLETAKHYDDLGEYSKQYASYLTFIALALGDIFSKDDLSEAIGHLPKDGLVVSANALREALDGTKKKKEYWKNRVEPFIKNCWPKSLEFASPQLSERVAHVCVSANASFAEAISLFQYWFQPVEHPDYLIKGLCKAELCSRYPSEALIYCSALIGDDPRWLPDELQQCLDEIKDAELSLVKDKKYIRLVALVKKFRS